MRSPEDHAGHLHQMRQAQERVILAALAVWPDGCYYMLHYEVATGEEQQSWLDFFEHLIKRGLNPEAVQLVVSDGTVGLPKAMEQCLPQATQQRCTTHKVRGMEKYLTYQHLPKLNAQGEQLSVPQAKQQRRFEIHSRCV